MAAAPEFVSKQNLSIRQIKHLSVANAIGWSMFGHRRVDEGDTEVQVTDEEAALCELAASNALEALHRLGY